MGIRSKLAEELITKMYSQPIMSPRQVEEELGVVPATANALLRSMEETGILKEITGQGRNRNYELCAYLELFKG